MFYRLRSVNAGIYQSLFEYAEISILINTFTSIMKCFYFSTLVKVLNHQPLGINSANSG